MSPARGTTYRAHARADLDSHRETLHHLSSGAASEHPSPRAQAAALHRIRSSFPYARLAPSSLIELDATIDNGTAAIVQWQNAALWQRMSWVRTPLAAPKFPLHRGILPQPLRSIFAHSLLCASFVRSTTLPRASKAPEPVSAPPSAPN